MKPFRDVLYWWKDNSVTNFISNRCLTSHACLGGVWFALDETMLGDFGRVIYFERGPNRVPKADKETRNG